MQRLIPPLLALALSVGCGGRSAMKKGALSQGERQEYVEQTGALIPQELQKSFVEGVAAKGMTKEMVVFLYGQPDRTENDRYGIAWTDLVDSLPPSADMKDSIWNYFTPDSS